MTKVRRQEPRAGLGARGASDGHGQAGPLAEREANGRQDVGGRGERGRHERAVGEEVAAWAAPLDDEGGAGLAHEAGPVRRGVDVGDRAAAAGGRGREARGEDGVRGGGPASARRVRGGATPHAAASGAVVACRAGPGQGGLLPAGARTGSCRRDRLHARQRAARDHPRVGVPAHVLPSRAGVQRASVRAARVRRDVRGAAVGSAGGPCGASRVCPRSCAWTTSRRRRTS